MKEGFSNDFSPKRKQVRLRGYDYSLPGAYFVTICMHDKECLFGNIDNGTMRISPYGEIVKECWKDIPHHYDGIGNDIFTIMPNHMHGIIVIHKAGWADLKSAPTKKRPLSEIVRAFKTYSSRRINELRKVYGRPIWQHGYYEHIIRSEKEYREIGDYIINNPAKWDIDSENPIVRLN